MDTQSLTDRYIDAALRSVPERQRADIGAELRASIADQIDARVEAGEPVQDAERAVLTALGDPDRLAAGYADRPLHLIGPRYYLDWKRLLKLLLAIVPACAAFGVALGQVLAGVSFGTVVGSVVSVVIAVVVHLAFWVTLVFAVIERTGVKRGERGMAAWSLDHLPQPRDRGAGLGDMIATLVWLAVAAAAVLWDHFLGLAHLGDGWIPFLSPGLWPWWIAALLALMALEAIVAVAVYARRAWTVPLAAVNGILNLAIALPALWLLWEHRLVNPDVTAALVDVAGIEVFGPGGVVTVVVGFAVAAIAAWSTIDPFLKVRAARSSAAPSTGR